LTVSELATDFSTPERTITTTDITWGITLVLMFRSVGAIIFGVAGDRYGRKWPFIINNFLFIALELGTGFCTTYEQFLAVRALFGIAMGGLYGNVAATALEDCPERARGIISGMLQQGYAFGYLLAAAFSRALVDTTPHGWRPLFWFGGAVPILLIIFRLFLGETDAFIERQRVRKAGDSVGKTFIQEGKVALRRHWKVLIYMVLLAAGFNFMSHGSQDLYPTMLKNQYNFSATQITVTQIVANLGAMTGGTTIGYLSQMFGRRFSIIVICIIGGLLLYPYSFIGDNSVMAAAFFEQFCVQGAWGVIPIHLMELSPGSFRTFVVGTSYQLGNLVSSASSTIEATIGERFPLPPRGTTKRYEYGKVVSFDSSTLTMRIDADHFSHRFAFSWRACTSTSLSSPSSAPSTRAAQWLPTTTRISPKPLAKPATAMSRSRVGQTLATMSRPASCRGRRDKIFLLGAVGPGAAVEIRTTISSGSRTCSRIYDTNIYF
jgi:SHS family lactate transporter-like MFS transporter